MVRQRFGGDHQAALGDFDPYAGALGETGIFQPPTGQAQHGVNAAHGALHRRLAFRFGLDAVTGVAWPGMAMPVTIIVAPPIKSQLKNETG